MISKGFRIILNNVFSNARRQRPTQKCSLQSFLQYIRQCSQQSAQQCSRQCSEIDAYTTILSAMHLGNTLNNILGNVLSNALRQRPTQQCSNRHKVLFKFNREHPPYIAHCYESSILVHLPQITKVKILNFET